MAYYFKNQTYFKNPKSSVKNPQFTFFSSGPVIVPVTSERSTIASLTPAPAVITAKRSQLFGRSVRRALEDTYWRQCHSESRIFHQFGEFVRICGCYPRNRR